MPTDSEVPPVGPAAPAPAAASHAAPEAEGPDTVPDALNDPPAEPLPSEAASAVSDGPATESPEAGVVTDVTSPAATAAPPPDLSPAATGARLAALFPALFVGPDGKGMWKPIKLRIHADIQARAPGQFSKRTLGIFFSRYTTTTPYLKALAAEGAQRCDLDGQAAGEISDEHRQLAVEEVARRQAIAAERRAAHRPPRREPPPTRAAPGKAPAAPANEDAQGRPPGPRREARTDRPTERRVDDRPSASQQPRDGGPRPDRPPRRSDEALRSPHPERPSRPPRYAERSAQDGQPQRPEREPPTMRREPPAALLPIDPAQRERVMLMRAFESSPLSKANFCALKGISEAALDAALAQNQAERGAASSSGVQRGSGAR